ncbi:MAG: Asp-tRNA(Asn)/Glu-tRNA(Gln) amidotransferase subunit GatB, partial [Candidatus Zixiibacteriota bacterium]
VEYAVMMILAVGGEVQNHSIFARKNYFYPDLPKGYQISQYIHPLGLGGKMNISTVGGNKRKIIRIKRIHLEEDAGKLLHSERGENYSRVDYNRCGVPLIEIVSEPDIASPAEAYNYLLKLRQVLQYLGICTGDMEKGHLRCDANVSVHPKGTTELGVRTELKNLNSFKFIEKALDYEIMRQISVIESGRQVEQCTMMWDEKKQTAEMMRTKEESEDYRYFPEPDLPPLVLADKQVELWRAELPELPDARYSRFVEHYGLSGYDVGILTESRDLADYYEVVMSKYNDAKMAANWMINDVLMLLNDRNISIGEFKVTPVMFSGLLSLVQSGEISGKMAGNILSQMADTGQTAGEIIKKEGLSQIKDYDTIENIVNSVLDKEKENVRKYLSGKNRLFDHFVGQVMKQTEGKANPELVNKILREKLNGLAG